MTRRRESVSATTSRLRTLTEELLKRDREAHAIALDELGEIGDERVIPHLIDLVMIDSIANDWERFGFPEVLRAEKMPRYLELPDVNWPGVVDALCRLAEPVFDSDIAWVKWESWYSQQDITPLEGYDEWKVRLFKSFVPPVGSLLDVEPRQFNLEEVRYGNTDRSFLAALNHPEFVPAETVEIDGEGGEHERYLRDDAVVYGFEIGDQAYAIPRMVLFPHEFMNATLQGKPIMLAWCTLCNAPILYDRRVDGVERTFGNTGMLWQGNKVMYDEETESLWAHHRGTPLAGHYLGERAELEILPVSQTDWATWKADNSDTLVPHLETGYGYDYRHYDGNIGFFEHYWGREDITQPGVNRETVELPEKEPVYGISGDDLFAVHVYPIDSVIENEPIGDTIEDRDLVVVTGVQGDDVAAYEAPVLPVERENDTLVDAEGTVWDITRDALISDDGRLDRIPGRHGLWFAFRLQYDDFEVVHGG